MIFFRSDYSQGAHPDVLEALIKTNAEHTDGYGLDPHCDRAAKMVKDFIGRDDCGVHMMVGGTPTNVALIAAALRPYESVIAPRTGHIYIHETGAVEATGHRIIGMNGVNGKLTPDLIDLAWEEFEDEHTPLPRLVYISQPTETGSIYSKAELTAISKKCKENNMLLYIDGARLGVALTCKDNDTTIEELAALCDAFYIGGTKNGALFGEALVIFDKETEKNFRFFMKRQCGLLAKGRLIGVQFEALLEGGRESVFYKIAREMNRTADRLKEGLKALGTEFYSESQTNQLFPVFTKEVKEELEKDFFFHQWAPEKNGKVPVRLVTSWGTTDEEVDAFLKRVKELTK